MPKIKKTREEVVKILQDHYAKTGKPPRRSEFGDIQSAVNTHFGGWNKGLQAAGINVNRVLGASREKLIESLKRFYNENERAPKAYETNKYDYLFDHKTYIYGLGVKTWGQVLQEAGLDPHINARSPLADLNDELLLEVLKCVMAAWNNTMKPYYDKNRGRLPSAEYLVTRFGFWTDMLDRMDAGRNKNKYSEEYIISQFNLAKEYYKKTPSSRQIEEFTGVNTRTLFYKWGSYNKFLKANDFKLNQKTPDNSFSHLSDEELIELYKDFSHKNGFPNGATSIALDISPDVPSSDVYALRFRSINKLRRLCGYEIDRKREIIDISIDEAKQAVRDMFIKNNGIIPTYEEYKELDYAIPLTTLQRIFHISSLKTIFNISIEKKCTKCNIIKTFDNFRDAKNYKSGKQSTCIQCEKKYQKKYQKKYNRKNPKKKPVTDQELINEYVKFSLKLGYENGAPVHVLKNQKKIHSLSFFNSRFGGLTKLRKLAFFNNVQYEIDNCKEGMSDWRDYVYLLDRFIKTSDITKLELSQRSGIALSQIYNFFFLKKTPRLKTFISIANSIGFGIEIKSSTNEALKFTFDLNNSAFYVKALKVIYIDKGLKQTDIAKITGISQANLSALFTNKSIPQLDTFVKIANAIGAYIELKKNDESK